MKLKKETFRYFNKESRQEFDVTIGVSQSDGTFYFKSEDIPAEMHAVTEKIFTSKFRHRKNGYETSEMKEIKEVINEAIKAFEDSLVKRDERKVIAFKFEITGQLTPDIKGEDGEVIERGLNAPSRSYSRWNNEEDLGVKMKWYVLNEITNVRKDGRRDDDVIYLKFGTNEEESLHDDEKVIPWTEEREEWFKWVESGLKDLLINIFKFQELDAKQIEAIVDAKIPVPFMLVSGDKREIKKEAKAKDRGEDTFQDHA